jgi:hypothetical protein
VPTTRSAIRRGLTALAAVERRTRPVDADASAALARRWAALPEVVKTPAQLLGRRANGCEGTHGVFPQCDFSCKPCYHSADANKVAIDGAHTVAEVTKQMTYLLEQRGPGQYAQLIGGEVSLLAPEDHAAALAAMHAAKRVPMSFTHGDFDYEYLEKVAVGPDGRRRFDVMSFAGHFDTTMFGRRGIEKPEREADLDPYRQAFCAMFDRLEAEHGVKSYLAHNMTVTPGNIDEIPDIIRSCRAMGFRMFSFQPAGYVGNENRWADGFRHITDDDVWDRVEAGAGTRLPFRAIEFGDTRCNRVVWGLYVGDRYVPVLDDEEPADLAVRDLFFETFPTHFMFMSRPLMLLRGARCVARRPRMVPAGWAWARRMVSRAGGIRALRHGVAPVTFVMHSFMDAGDVAAAWELLQRGETATDERILATQERLQACAYSMAHPESDQLVPACVQHSLLDPHENTQLVQLLPRKPRQSEPAVTGPRP